MIHSLDFCMSTLYVIGKSLSSTDACPVLCHGNGIYTGGECRCHAGWTGRECEVAAQECDDHLCVGNGRCVGGHCLCTAGYAGTNCTESKSSWLFRL